jgi:fermentation-respiration switch protein FrsA (DUF1100 family)
LISDRFKNIEKIANVKSPTFLVHGKQDQLISYKHSIDLHKACGGPCGIVTPDRMCHNDFDFNTDLINPFL